MADTIDVNEKTTPYVAMKLQDGSTAYVKQDSLDFYDYKSELNILNPVSGQLSPTNSTYVDFDLNAAGVHRIDNVFFSVTITNTDAVNALLLMPLSFLINRVELLCNSATVATLYSQDLFLQTLMSDSEMLAVRGLSEGFVVNPTTGALTADTTTLAALASRTYSLPIHSFLSQAFMPILKTNNAKIRVYFNAGSTLVQSTSVAAYTSISYGTPLIHIQGRVYGRKTLERLMEEYRKAPHMARCIIRREQRINVGAVTAGSEYQQLLGALTGSYSLLRFSLLPSGAQQENQIAYRQLSEISLFDSVGRPWSFAQISDALIRQQIIPSKNNTLIAKANYLYELPFARDPVGAFQTNRSAGSVYMDGRWYIRFKPAANSAGVDLIINGHEYAVFRQDPDGSVKIMQIKSMEY